LLFGLVAVVVGDGFKKLFLGDTIEGRINLWRSALELLPGHYFTGIGCFPLIFSSPSHLQNSYLELYFNNGVLGCLAAFFSFIVVGKLAINIFQTPRSHIFGIGTLLAILATVAVGVFESAAIGIPIKSSESWHHIFSPVPWILGSFLVIEHKLAGEAGTLP